MRKLVVILFAYAALAACAQPAQQLTAEQLVQRGDYMVNGVVMCGDCHTPTLETHELDLSRRLQGAPFEAPPPLANYAPAIAGGPASFTEEQFVSFLQTGVRPDGSHPRPPMPAYRLNEEDARAVAAYIRSLPRAPE